jgi:hypothetical protein
MDNQEFVPEPNSVLPLPNNVFAYQMFGQLRVVHRVANDASGRVRLRCQCGCGREFDARLSDLRSKHTQSCGCLKDRVLRRQFFRLQLMRIYNLIPFGKCRGGDRMRASTKWMAMCVFCRKFLVASAFQIRRAKKKCPCQKETYGSWRNMLQRCTNKNHDQYKDYGGRGIRVCVEWRNNFQQFAFDMGRRPPGKTLDRIDPDGPYCTENCRWGDAQQQAQNRRRPARKVPPGASHSVPEGTP